MSWLFSQALVGEYSAGCSSDGEQFAPSSSTNTPAMFLSQGKTTEASNLSRFGMMCEVLTENLGAVLLTSFREAFHAKILAPQKELEQKELMEKKADCGKICLESLAKYDPASRSWKTAQLSLFGGLSEFSEIWPCWGMVLCMEFFPLPMLAHDTSVRGYGLSECVGTPIKSQRSRSAEFMDGRIPNPFEMAKFMEMIPRPEWCENLMDWPIGWTDMRELEMAKFQAWYKKHGTSCAKKLGRKKNNMVVCKTSYNSRVTQGVSTPTLPEATS